MLKSDPREGMTITVTLKDEVAQIIEQQIAEGRYPDAESAATTAPMLLEDFVMDWSAVDAVAVKRIIAESDAEGGEISFDEIRRRLATKSSSSSR
jgi:Arc/MetJ-type ribon-helix-helix transcriptional regulator